jgi:hypothetical protein
MFYGSTLAALCILGSIFYNYSLSTRIEEVANRPMPVLQPPKRAIPQESADSPTSRFSMPPLLACKKTIQRVDLTPEEIEQEIIRLKNFNKKETVDLTLAIITINGWNRLAVSFRKLPT